MNVEAARKAQLRRQIRALRKALSPTRKRRAALAAARHALRWPLLRRARRVALYVAVGSELSTAPLLRALRAAGKTVLLPWIDRLRPGHMKFVPLSRTGALRRGAFGIAEPWPSPSRGPRIDLMLLPLLAFDDHGRRLGSGGGYYDRWLQKHRRPRCCAGYGYALQEVPAIPAEPWDVPLDAVCTDRGLRYRARPAQQRTA